MQLFDCSLALRKRSTPFYFSALAILAWILLAAATNPAQFGDNIEQLNWAHGLEWGYWKHPPLPTAILAGLIAVAGPSPYWTYLLAAACFIGTAFFTWKIASRLLGADGGGIAVVLLTLHLGFSWRAQIYNHNTVLLLAVAATAALALDTVSRPALWRWALAGVAAGLALLSKYQAAVPLAGLLYALVASGALRPARQRLGLACALGCAALVFLPHLLWLVHNHFPTLQYASHADQHLGPAARAGRFLAFLATQVRFHFPTLAALGAAFAFLAPRAAPARNPAPDPLPLTPWMWGLIGVPALILCTMVLAGGISLEGHWGLQTFQFIPVLIAAKLVGGRLRLTVRGLLIAALAIHLIGMVLYVNSSATPKARQALQSRDRIYPAAQLAHAVSQSWQAGSSCALAYVSGPPFESGLIAAYSGGNQAVLEDGDPKKSPWIDLSDLRRRGAVHVAVHADELARLQQMAGAGPLYHMAMPGRGKDPELERTVYWRMMPPAQPCGTPATEGH